MGTHPLLQCTQAPVTMGPGFFLLSQNQATAYIPQFGCVDPAFKAIMCDWARRALKTDEVHHNDYDPYLSAVTNYGRLTQSITESYGLDYLRLVDDEAAGDKRASFQRLAAGRFAHFQNSLFMVMGNDRGAFLSTVLDFFPLHSYSFYLRISLLKVLAKLDFPRLSWERVISALSMVPYGKVHSDDGRAYPPITGKESDFSVLMKEQLFKDYWGITKGKVKVSCFMDLTMNLVPHLDKDKKPVKGFYEESIQLTQSYATLLKERLLGRSDGPQLIIGIVPLDIDLRVFIGWDVDFVLPPPPLISAMVCIAYRNKSDNGLFKVPPIRKFRACVKLMASKMVAVLSDKLYFSTLPLRLYSNWTCSLNSINEDLNAVFPGYLEEILKRQGALKTDYAVYVKKKKVNSYSNDDATSLERLLILTQNLTTLASGDSVQLDTDVQTQEDMAHFARFFEQQVLEQ